MKNRTKVIVAFLLIAAMTIGIGYAALVDQLKVTGTASIDTGDVEDAFEADVYFSKVIANADRVTAIIDGADNDVATMTVKDGAFAQVNDEVIATYTVKSDSDLPVKLVPTIGNDNPSYFTVTHNLPLTDGYYVLAAGSTVDITVTVKLAQTPLASQTANFSLTIDATAMANA